MAVTEMHEEKNTFEVDINLPGHDPRGAATALFSRSRKALIEREGGKCWLSGLGADVLGPLEAHHYPVERCFAEGLDWVRFSNDCKFGHWGPYAAAFDWSRFFEGAVQVDVPAGPDTDPYSYLKVVDPYVFVDDMTVNGRLLGKC